MGLIQNVADDGLGGLEHNFLTGRVEELVKWSRSRSSWGATFGLACCAIEMMTAGTAHYDVGPDRYVDAYLARDYPVYPDPVSRMNYARVCNQGLPTPIASQYNVDDNVCNDL